MTEMPTGWRSASIGEVASVDSGPAFQSKLFGGPHEGTRLLRGDNIEPGALRWQRTRTWPDDRLSGFESLLVEVGDIILAMDRPVITGGLKLGRVTPHDLPALLVQRVARIRATGVENGYLYRLLESRQFVRHLRRNQVGTQVPHITLKTIRDFPVPLPPINEQRRIVDFLEGHLSRLDAAGSALTTSHKRLKRFHQAALDACVQAAIRDSSTSTTTIGSLARVGTGATPLKSRADYYVGGDIPWVTSGDLAQGFIQKATHFVTPVALDETAIKLWPVGTLLVAMYGEGKTRGTTAELGIEATTNQACAAIQMHDPDLSLKSWVRLILESNYWSMRRMASGGVQPNLNLGLVRGIEIPVPARDTQERLIRARNAQVEVEQGLARALVTSERRSLSLRRSLLSAAFSGRLTGRSRDLDIAEVLTVTAV